MEPFVEAALEASQKIIAERETEDKRLEHTLKDLEARVALLEAWQARLNGPTKPFLLRKGPSRPRSQDGRIGSVEMDA